MSKGTQTREMIVARAAQLFNRQGYFGSSLSDIMEETGLEKGGIYNHFASKEQLALEAFDYAFGLHQKRIQELLAGKRHAVERLLAMLVYFQDIVEDPLIAGGCPILNTAVEANDIHPALRDRARAAMDSLRDTMERIVLRGIERHELRLGIDASACATLFIAMLEGAVMLSRLYDDPAHMRRAVEYLKGYIETSLREESVNSWKPALSLSSGAQANRFFPEPVAGKGEDSGSSERDPLMLVLMRPGDYRA
ncbi:MAG TPA: TetR/AcrR family transcriptional regulator [Ktedonosporobacter sp.]|nr:TetR/AcrR family transcriptional regulator [Ktedonosporobacter sp.]